MKHLFSIWDNIKKELETRYSYLFLDCDGTLAPIVDTPEQASVPQNMKEVLAALSRITQLKIAIISGRSLNNVKSMVGLDKIIYVGNHGLEIEGDNIASGWEPTSSYKNSLAEIKVLLESELAVASGAFVEDKGLSLSIHYRMSNIDEEMVKAIFRRVIEPYKTSGKIVIMYGKKVIEVRPATGWDKGKIVKWLLTRERLLAQNENIVAVYVGDDQTDEDAFMALGDSGISVMVGNVPISSAKYYVDDTNQVYQLLTMILQLRSG